MMVTRESNLSSLDALTWCIFLLKTTNAYKQRVGAALDIRGHSHSEPNGDQKITFFGHTEENCLQIK